jgi:hypothetical protein
VIVTHLAKERKAGFVWAMRRWRSSRNAMWRSFRVLVRPGVLVFTTSHGRTAKKKPAMMMSIAWS